VRRSLDAGNKWIDCENGYENDVLSAVQAQDVTLQAKMEPHSPQGSLG